ncbi:MAG: hypothetical protein H7Y11_14775 [Armatimonadetes bacterium]|nr:hypothetical protein [Anaerolineae bacterium]
MMKLQVGWIEIPVQDIQRATAFYGALFDTKFDIIPQELRSISVIASPPDANVGVSLNQTAHFVPSNQGSFVSYAAGDQIETLLARVEPAGGKIITRRGELSVPKNYYASVQDTEGNVFGLVWAEA